MALKCVDTVMMSDQCMPKSDALNMSTTVPVQESENLGLRNLTGLLIVLKDYTVRSL